MAVKPFSHRFCAVAAARRAVAAADHGLHRVTASRDDAGIDAGTDLHHDAGNLMADDGHADGLLAVQHALVGAAQGAGLHLEQDLSGLGLGSGDLFDGEDSGFLHQGGEHGLFLPGRELGGLRAGSAGRV